eukprot:TRINITY_DN20999_c0_g1_i2.p1 TRINITY_DN20999_c0_g1~~TRINITY_DN20999_c0_g1_i2.p1  ORF type:complete len:267 (-),score=57.69 TRINITY_DN20999_c0_g1_i2:277-1077(-)
MKSLMNADNDDQQVLPVPMSAMRITQADSARTQFLKKQLRHLVSVAETSKKDSSASKAQKAGRSVGASSRSLATSRSSPPAPATTFNAARVAASGLFRLKSNDGIDEQCTEIADSRELAPALRECGKQINAHCERLLAIQPPTPPETEDVARRRCAPKDPRDDVRPPQKAVDMVRSRVERLALQYITDNVKFKQLEDISETLDRCTTYEDLRDAFPRRFFHHPNTKLLADHLLDDEQGFIDAVWTPARQPATLTMARSVRFVQAFI